MPPASALPSIGRCSALSRSFLLGPDGPAGAPPGHCLRSGVYMAANEKQGQPRSANRSVHAFRGTADGGPVAGRVVADPLKGIHATDTNRRTLIAKLLDGLGVAVGHLALLSEFDGTKCQCAGPIGVPDAGPEPRYANDDCAADADRGGRQGGIHPGSVRASRHVGSPKARAARCRGGQKPWGNPLTSANRPGTPSPAADRA